MAMEILEYWKIVRKRLWIIIALMVLAGAVATGYVLQQPRFFRATTTLVINPKALESAVSYQISAAVEPITNTYSELMRLSWFGEAVAAELGQDIPVDEVLNALSAQYLRDTQLFRVTATHQDPELAQAIANATVRAIIRASAERAQAEQQAQREAQLAPEQRANRERMRELNQVLQDELTYYNDIIVRLESQIGNLQNGPRSEEIDAQVLTLRNELLSYRTERVDLLGSLAETQKSLIDSEAQTATKVDTILLLEEATLPTAPLPRSLLQPILAAIAAALALGVGIAWLLEYIDYTIKKPEQLDEVYGVASLGAIGMAGTANAALRREDSLITVSQPRSPIAEAFRSVRTAIRMASLGQPIRSLVITSAGPGEGKTFVATNLAISLAQEGKRVILVDADLRRPQLHRVFGLGREPGFTNLVVDRELTLEQALRPTPVRNLSVLTAGTVPPNPAELLSSTRAVQVLELLGQHADIVVFDTPPAATVTDAVIVASHMDAALQVVHAGKVRIDAVRRCKSLLEQAGVRILGPVLNQVELSDMGYYSYHYYYGYYQENGDQEVKRSGLSRPFGLGRLFGNGKSSGKRRRRHRSRPDNGQFVLEEPPRQEATDA